MKRFAFAGALGLIAALAAGQAYAQMEGIGNGGLGDARAQNLPTSQGINNSYGPQPYSYGYAPAPGYVAGPPVYPAARPGYRGRSAYMPRHRPRHHRH
jgi:hypothetical protein